MALDVVAGERDRFVDCVRISAMLIVVAGHWLVLIPSISDGVAGGRILYDVDPRFWPLTWVFDVLPLFFFVGGFANFTSYSARAGRREGERFHSRRLRRLLEPTLVFLGVWVLFEAALHALGAGGGGLLRGMRLGHITPFESLWFLSVYLVVVAAGPITIALHRRFGAAVPLALVGAVLATDAIALGAGHHVWLAPNILLAWMLPHQLGYFYAEGRLRGLGARKWLAVAGAAMAAAALLTSLPFYARNLLDGEVPFLGITAPTLPFDAMCVWMVAGAMALRGTLSRLLANGRVWEVVRRLNSVAMTVFLWYMTSFFAVVLALVALGLRLPRQPDAAWWAQRPLFLLLPSLALLPLVWLFGRFERARS